MATKKIPDAELLAMACEFDVGPVPLLMGKLVEPEVWWPADIKLHHVYVKNAGHPDGGPDRWSIANHSSCLNKDGEWQYQMMNSQKTEDFYTHCRFASCHEAILYYRRWYIAIVKWAREKMAAHKEGRLILNYEDCPIELRKF